MGDMTRAQRTSDQARHRYYSGAAANGGRGRRGRRHKGIAFGISVEDARREAAMHAAYLAAQDRAGGAKR